MGSRIRAIDARCFFVYLLNFIYRTSIQRIKSVIMTNCVTIQRKTRNDFDDIVKLFSKDVSAIIYDD